MTRYRLVHAPEAGPFNSATEAIFFAFAHNLNPSWEAVSA